VLRKWNEDYINRHTKMGDWGSEVEDAMDNDDIIGVDELYIDHTSANFSGSHSIEVIAKELWIYAESQWFIDRQ
ncbi:9888_t:CDS:2, partial [Funneliformis geosporum]